MSAARDDTSEGVDRLRRALGWAIAEQKQVPGVLTTRDLALIDQAFDSCESLPVELYPKLACFAQILARIELPEGVPKCTLGDALDAVGAIASSLPPWRFEPAVEPATLDALGYATNAEGIDREYAKNRRAWSVHGAHSRRFIGQALTTLERRQTVWVLGAGRAYDLPLADLAQHFREVVLVDIDHRALKETLRTIDPSLRSRFELVAADLTGIAAQWRVRADEAILSARDAFDAATRLLGLFRGYALADEPLLRWSRAAPDLIISQMLLSQLNEPLERYARRAHERRFAAPLLEGRPVLRLANMLFAHRVQHDHLRFLRRHARVSVLTSDVTEQYTRLSSNGDRDGDRDGNGDDAVELIGDELTLLGAYHLNERVPSGLRIVQQDGWHWDRAIPRAREIGSRMRIGALLLEARP